MNYFRAVFTGILVWLLVSIAFTILELIPVITDSLNLQALIVGILIIPFATLGAQIYYKNGNKKKGIIVGPIMVITALLLDAVITVPFIEIPKGGSYLSFYSFPLLWLLVLVNMITVYLYWSIKVKPN